MDFTRDRRKTHHAEFGTRLAQSTGPQPSVRVLNLALVILGYYELARNCLNWQQFRLGAGGPGGAGAS